MLPGRRCRISHSLCVRSQIQIGGPARVEMTNRKPHQESVTGCILVPATLIG
ncbi:hypothetical protein COCC4DRAFT_29689 [Bipolaris maydis ATCC 48331]|uniref:Uncharacterized protein n=3 Tax=Bipolaris TaxID=33194 RepID=M2TU38_COCH5|nr:uncharacterized protein COCMIDRAFT_88876 [Bipolaris oryzae ATCC 44560]XP_014083641.1 uncharacterized protein COCC4DRAFT_29689 [Bipolaris maydis ATCC 48331]EMD90054.1 hypothetical protein COCHEDRAFT_1022155 [Bipolaris maydis C5]ENI09732.1 hypothetical protein COCC4DRAFT_29689 [Bipolaris maydis ATCC 48331]EUC47884.1 hypothetical protein COCMIDRAFT_88876 [Bipolaris oryzae ATCC 44560]